MNGTCRHWFVSVRGDLLPGWREAFPDAVAVTAGLAPPPGAAVPLLVWARLPGGLEADAFLNGLRSCFGPVPLVALSDRPDDEEALACLAAGARGYCNSHAAPAVLERVADTVLKDGLWIGESLMRRWRQALARADAGHPRESAGG